MTVTSKSDAALRPSTVLYVEREAGHAGISLIDLVGFHRAARVANTLVYLQFYAQEREGVWPPPDKYYVLDDYEAHEARLNCWDGEQICYGAWTNNGSEWGVGRNDSRGCENCCATCWNGDEGTRNLNP